MLYGCMRKILFIDLSTMTIVAETPDDSLYRDYLGGYGIGAKILLTRQKPGVDPLGPENTLGILAGILTGTPVPLSSRYAVVAKSPLTDTWGDANSGGYFGPHLKFAGVDAVFFSGIAEQPTYLFVQDGQAVLRDASHLWGKDTYETDVILKRELGKDVIVTCIGPSGESLSLLSCIINDGGRAAGRSGLGAVMGSKNLKAIAVRGTQKVPISDTGKTEALRKFCLQKIAESHLTKLLRNYGTSGFTVGCIQSGDCPVKNWGGVGIRDFAAADNLDGEHINHLQEKRYACWHCPIGCGGTMQAGKEYIYPHGAAKPEYETMGTFGALCLNSNLPSIIMANDICNRYGLDTMSAGSAIAFAMECYENSIITKDDTDGLELNWGNHEAIVAMTGKMARREGFGAILADGVRRASQQIGKGSEQFAIHIGGQELPMHDPKKSRSFSTVYKIDATPGRHTQSGDASDEGEKQKARNIFCQAYNAAGVCQWLASIIGPELLAESLTAVTGHQYDLDALLLCGERISNTRHIFNLREGMNALQREVPRRVLGIPPHNEGPLSGITLNMDTRIANYLKSMDWDQNTTIPVISKLKELGLQDFIPVLYQGKM